MDIKTLPLSRTPDSLLNAFVSSPAVGRHMTQPNPMPQISSGLCRCPQPVAAAPEDKTDKEHGQNLEQMSSQSYNRMKR